MTTIIVSGIIALVTIAFVSIRHARQTEAKKESERKQKEIYIERLVKAESYIENLEKDNKLKSLSIEKHLNEKMEMQANYSTFSVDKQNKIKELEKEAELNESTIRVLSKDITDLREIITRKDETIARYKAEIEKLNSPSKKKPYKFDESKAPKTKSKAQIAAAKRLRTPEGKFA
jgi:uncharacterized coiled-coil protein SlyX